ncbi:MAG: hypothetical protein AB7V48_12470 [Sedimentibacter sp.]
MRWFLAIHHLSNIIEPTTEMLIEIRNIYKRIAPEFDDYLSLEEGILEVISTKDVNVLKDAIIEYSGVHSTASEIREFMDVNSKDGINILTFKVIFDRVSIYNDGSFFRPYAHKYNVEGNFTIEFEDEGSSISSDRILYLPKNDMKENIYFILIFDEGYRIAKVFIVK